MDYLISNSEYASGYHILSNDKLFTKKNISTFRKKEKKVSLGSKAFYYLKSNKYSGVLQDQKFVIMTQIAEGFVEGTEIEQLLLQTKYPNQQHLYFAQRIDYYIDKLKIISKHTKSSVFKVLNIKPDKLTDKIKQTRHRYSHYIFKDNTITISKSIFYFYLMDLIYRIVFLEECGINYDNNLKKYLYSIHDWILDNTRKVSSLNEYKTLSYILKKYNSLN